MRALISKKWVLVCLYRTLPGWGGEMTYSCASLARTALVHVDTIGSHSVSGSPYEEGTVWRSSSDIC